MSKHRSAIQETTPKQEKIPEPVIPGNLAERRWKLVQRELRYYWKFLNDEDVLRIAGKRDELLRVLHEKYSYTRAQAEKELGTALIAKRRKK